MTALVVFAQRCRDCGDRSGTRRGVPLSLRPVVRVFRELCSSTRRPTPAPARRRKKSRAIRSLLLFLPPPFLRTPFTEVPRHRIGRPNQGTTTGQAGSMTTGSRHGQSPFDRPSSSSVAVPVSPYSPPHRLTCTVSTIGGVPWGLRKSWAQWMRARGLSSSEKEYVLRRIEAKKARAQ